LRARARALQSEIDERNRPLTDEELDEILPGEKDGYTIVIAPEVCQLLIGPRCACSASRWVIMCTLCV
jgi:hypothetical protein